MRHVYGLICHPYNNSIQSGLVNLHSIIQDDAVGNIQSFKR